MITSMCGFFLAFEKISNLFKQSFKQKDDQSFPEFLPKPGIKGNA